MPLCPLLAPRALALTARRHRFRPPLDTPFCGIYRTQGERCRQDDLLVCQRRMNYHPGANVRYQRDRTQHLLKANCDGTVLISRERCHVEPANEWMAQYYAHRNFENSMEATMENGLHSASKTEYDDDGPNLISFDDDDEQKQKRMRRDKDREEMLEQCRRAVLRRSADADEQGSSPGAEQLASDGDAPLLGPAVTGYDFNEGVRWPALMDSLFTTGFQASHMGVAIQEINAMIEERAEPVQLDPGADPCHDYPAGRKRRALTLFLGYTSNMVTSGLRDIFRFLAEHDQVDCIVTSAGGVEEDLIKCLRPTHLGSFRLDGRELRTRGINRAGNLLIPNANYCAFEEWLMPILDRCLEEQKKYGMRWTPSKLIQRLGSEIGCPSSICHWAWRHRIPIFCPALTDGSLGDMLYFHSVRNDGNGLVLDIVEDLRHLNTLAVRSPRTGVLILGGGVVKHHINNANLMRNGSDRTVYINTGTEFDGSDSGAEPDEAVSWGKVKGAARAVKVHADATLVFPLIVARTFARHVEEEQKRKERKRKSADAEGEKAEENGDGDAEAAMSTAPT